MSKSNRRVARTTPYRQPVTRVELRDHEEWLAIRASGASVRRLDDRAKAAIEARGKIRRRPFTTTAIDAVLGFLGVHRILRKWKAVFGSWPGFWNRKPRARPGFALATVRRSRGTRRKG